MKKRLLVTSLLVLALLTGTGAASAEARSKEDAIRQLLDVTGMNALLDQRIDQVVPMAFQNMSKIFKKAYPNAPARTYTMMEKELTTAFKETKPIYIAGAVEIYSKHFTLDEIDKMILFHKTDLGQKMVHTLPELMHELTIWGAQWGGPYCSAGR